MNIAKKFIVISNQPSGNFAEAFRQHSIPEPDILFLSAKAYGKRSVDGDLIEAPEVQTIILDFLKEQPAHVQAARRRII